MLTNKKETRNLVTLKSLTIEEKHLQQQKMRDVYLLVESIAYKEEATIKLIIDCLYDVGIVNAINKKITNRHLNKLAKFLKNTPKPIVKIIAWRWAKKNLASFTTRWLYNRIKFK